MPKTEERPFSMFYLSTQRGISNPPHVESDRNYYGLVSRLARGTHPENPKFIEWNEQTLNNLQAKALTKSCVKGGEFAAGELVERYDCFDIDNGDWLTMYRVPYKAEGTPRADWAHARMAAIAAGLNRSERRKAQAAGFGGVIAAPPNASDHCKTLITRVLRIVESDKFAADNKGNEHTEQNALALLTVAAHEIGKMPPSDHRTAIVTQMGEWLDWLVRANDDRPDTSFVTSDVVEQAMAEGVGTVVEISESDDDDRTN